MGYRVTHMAIGAREKHNPNPNPNPMLFRATGTNKELPVKSSGKVRYK